MDLENWREQKKNGEAFVTASGLSVRLRKVTLMALIEQGGIPTPLVGVVNSLITESTALTAENLRDYLAAVNLVVKAAVIDPPVADESGPGVLGVQELSPDERMEIYTWATAEVGRLMPFLPGFEQPADFGQPGAALPAAAGGPAGDNGYMAGLPGGPGGSAGGQQQNAQSRRRAGKGQRGDGD